MFRSFATLVSVLVWTTATFAADSPPNVVIVVGDDQGWRDYGFMGHPKIQTPHLDKLAADGLTFSRGYVPSSLCRPSLATMITGLYPHQHGITSNDPPSAGKEKDTDAVRKERTEMVEVFRRSPNLAGLLEKAGYATFQTGKWWEGDACRCGFGAGMTHGDPDRKGRHGDEGLKIGREGVEPVAKFIAEARQAKKPFFVWYAPMMPHTPHNPPARLLAKYEPTAKTIHIARYQAMCEWFDETVGDILGILDKEDVARDTLVVYLHDNGWIQNPDRPVYAPKSKLSQYDGGLRTPILLRWPARIRPADGVGLASSIDLAPTILKAAGVKPPPDLPGVNLLDSAAVAARPAVFGEIFEHTAIDLREPAANLKYRWIIAGSWKLIVPEKTRVPAGEVELYNLAADPNEETNLAADQPARVAALRERLDAWWAGKPH